MYLLFKGYEISGLFMGFHFLLQKVTDILRNKLFDFDDDNDGGGGDDDNGCANDTF